MNLKRKYQATLFLKLTRLENHVALLNSDPELGQMSWETFGSAMDAPETTHREYILLDVFRFLLIGKSCSGLQSLSGLDAEDYEAVTACLHAVSDLQEPYEENL